MRRKWSGPIGSKMRGDEEGWVRRDSETELALLWANQRVESRWNSDKAKGLGGDKRWSRQYAEPIPGTREEGLERRKRRGIKWPFKGNRREGGLKRKSPYWPRPPLPHPSILNGQFPLVSSFFWPCINCPLPDTLTSALKMKYVSPQRWYVPSSHMLSQPRRTTLTSLLAMRTSTLTQWVCV
jgi:hypothetical protein